ncbi:hypothetical protein R3P38DRAFT_2756323 [Favolaschia claudopus]|uniref:Uncharacterized protein n=1 Tax=Favolaschia claudopus TaxID=2862362 RepID=A0AAW0EER6_9AGAR
MAGGGGNEYVRVDPPVIPRGVHVGDGVRVGVVATEGGGAGARCETGEEGLVGDGLRIFEHRGRGAGGDSASFVRHGSVSQKCLRRVCTDVEGLLPRSPATRGSFFPLRGYALHDLAFPIGVRDALASCFLFRFSYLYARRAEPRIHLVGECSRPLSAQAFAAGPRGNGAAEGSNSAVAVDEDAAGDGNEAGRNNQLREVEEEGWRSAVMSTPSTKTAVS